jgi:AcrR family transcriptional regulator
MRPSKKEDIKAATIRLIAQNGVKGTSIREIAAAAGVTEAAIYRHFKSKDDLCQQIYYQIVLQMAAEKEAIVTSQEPLSVRLREWARLTYVYYDRYPDAFTYVLLMNHIFPEDQNEITKRQGRLFMKLISGAVNQGQTAPINPDIAMSHFTGVLLNIPRLINDGLIPAPAVDYVEEVGAVLKRIFPPL